IRTKMLMFAVVATLLPSLTTVWISYIENKRALQAKAAEELLGVSAQALREVDLWTKELRYDLRVFSSSYEVTENLERIPQANGEAVHSGIYYKRLTDYLNSVRDRFPDYSELLVLDQHGHMVATSAPRARPVALPPDWANDLVKNDWALGAPYWDSTATHAELLVSVPIESARGAGRGTSGMQLLGALASRVNLRTVADTLRRFAPGESGQIYLMTRTGRLIVSSRGSSRELMRQGYSRDAANWLLAREGRAIQFGSFTGDRDVGLSVTTGGEVGYLTEVFNNMVARLREGRTELERLSVTDALTGLYNRLRMMEVLENEVRRSRRLHHHFSVVMADVDLFK